MHHGSPAHHGSMRAGAWWTGLSSRRRALLGGLALVVSVLAAGAGLRLSRGQPQPVPGRPAGRGAARSRVRRGHHVAGRAGRAGQGHRPDGDRGAAGGQRHGRPDGAGPGARRLREPGDRRRVGTSHRGRLFRRRRRGVALGRGLRRRGPGRPDHHPRVPAARSPDRRRWRRVRPRRVPGRLPAASTRQRPAHGAAAVHAAATAVAIAMDHRRPDTAAPRSRRRG